jgi:hypothetical protein
MRNLASASIITATGVAVATPSVACPATDPIFAAIEAHRLANAEDIKANEPCTNMVGKHRPGSRPRRLRRFGQVSKSKPDERGGFILTYTPTGKMEPVMPIATPTSKRVFRMTSRERTGTHGLRST